MVEKINVMWGESLITGEERDELLDLAQEKLNPQTEAPELMAAYRRVLEKLAALEKRVEALEGAGGEEFAEGEARPAWEHWDGVSDKYQPGAKVEHGGVKYVSVYAGQNVWEPGALGTSEMWKVWDGDV
jgi:hypothetical protein